MLLSEESLNEGAENNGLHHTAPRLSRSIKTSTLGYSRDDILESPKGLTMQGILTS